MKRSLIVPLPLLLALALSCASPEQPAERVVPTQETLPVPTSDANSKHRFQQLRRQRLQPPHPAGAASGSPANVPLPSFPSFPVTSFRPSSTPSTFGAAEVGEQVGEASLVIGVSVGSESVAYSVSYLSSREIVNDTVGGTPIAVTW